MHQGFWGPFLVQLRPFQAVTGEAPFWQAESSEPWLEIVTECPPKGGWLELGWHASLSGRVCRPQLKIEQGEEWASSTEVSSLLSGAPLGRQDAVVFVPPRTTRLLISPYDRPGAFAFRLTKMRWMGVTGSLHLGILRRPLVAAHALGAALIGRPFDFRCLMMEALNTVPLSRYATWRRRKLRMPDWSDFDGFLTHGLPHLHVFVEDAVDRFARTPWPPGVCVIVRQAPEPECLRNGISEKALLELIGGLADTDLFMFLPRGVQLFEAGLPALLTAAAADPEPAFFYGDEELEDWQAGRSVRVQSGFDPLSTFQVLSHSAAIAYRAGKVRGLLSRSTTSGPWCGQPLWRPLVTRQIQSRPALASRNLVERMASTAPHPRGMAPDEMDDVAVIIPTRDRLPLLRACLDTLRPTLPPKSELIIVDNDSASLDTIEFLDTLGRQDRCTVVRVAGAFNFSKLCNLGASATEKRLLVFLNNDTTIVSADWLAHLQKWALQPDIGAVGARLLYPSGRVQHSGVIIGLGGFAGHIDLNMEAESTGTFGRALSTHRLLAVTGACLAVEKVKFNQVGGFDEVNLPIELNDIDLCLRLGERGFRTVFSPEAVLVHHESASRGRGGSPDRYRAEKAYFAERWKGVRRGDPFWHPALSLLSNKGMLG
ncbi:glycosyltransferase family 2 protein [Rhabdaerophilum sp. SD176]|uniref:glycosyltransferase family 2 protein n=1 Tax=Rhabdaerophilum sp. SD176 TaxID=2983548 RepID=UPI0024DFDF08|nr:glycosyltransferase family 2 protein [Rhabdaerophilum sp. SD176]